MTSKTLVENFYKPDVLLDPELTASFLHDDVVLEWHSSKGFLTLGKNEIVALCTELSKAYIRSKARIGHILAEGKLVSLRYSHYVKTIENPREEMLLAHFIVIWEIRDGKLFRGYQMSQLS
jgi:predicted SnoaL-like aldol condensation-catalyzing enzyme